ncbi:hypothetical protein F5Y19DRAFT_407494 [Xylariaceae sp. FL1651]|nr:hypothetical protein F5Y19DRAFT_407494 [Xylariaceae sp. FL1651]
MSSPHRRLRVSWLTLFTLLTLALRVFATSPEISRSSATTTATTTTNSFGLERRQQMSSGTPCAGSEGQWNCMTDRFQRCGGGQWSAVQQCAAGTQCHPSGLTYEFHVQFADGYLGAAPPTSGGVPTAGAGNGISGGIVNWWLLGGLGGLAVRLAFT